jgi:hypothetical protein
MSRIAALGDRKRARMCLIIEAMSRVPVPPSG